MIKIIGLDIAKNVFQVHGIDETGQPALRRKLRRAGVPRLFSHLEPAVVGIEACHTAHHGGREIAALGHEVRLMPPSADDPRRQGCGRMAQTPAHGRRPLARWAAGAPPRKRRDGGVRQQERTHRLGADGARQ